MFRSVCSYIGLALFLVTTGCGTVNVTPDAGSDGRPGQFDARPGDDDGGGLLQLGDECSPGTSCQSGNCIDGYCCESSCDGQCEACDEPGQLGQCVAVTGEPHGERTACDGADTCAGSCNGTDTGACEYPTEVCRAASCTDGVATAEASCAAGFCPDESTVTCSTTSAKYCGATACTSITQVVAGYDYTCALLGDGSVRCWGANDSGQLGLGDDDPRAAPTPVPGLPQVTRISANVSYGGHTCAVLFDKTVLCWGSNGYGELGIGTADYELHATPANLLKAPSTPQDAVNRITGGWNSGCLLDTAGTAKCWGWNYYGSLGNGTQGSGTDEYYPGAVSTNPGGITFSRLATGYAHSCALSSEASPKVYCWGENSSKSVGVASPTVVVQATAVTTQPAVNSILANPLVIGGTSEVSCAIATNSTLQCWGGDYDGLLGRTTHGSATNTITPAPVCRTSDCGNLLTGVANASIGESHACAVSSGLVRCWGRNNHGQLGDNSTTPLYYAGTGPTFAQTVTMVAAGGFHTCALAGGELWCWGWNSSGQLGTGTQGSDEPTPVKIVSF